jgi:hypothetical protein
VSFLGGAKRSLGDAKSSLGDAKSSLGDAKSSLGDAKSLLGDAKSLLGSSCSRYQPRIHATNPECQLSTIISVFRESLFATPRAGTDAENGRSGDAEVHRPPGGISRAAAHARNQQDPP